MQRLKYKNIDFLLLFVLRINVVVSFTKKKKNHNYYYN